MSQEIRNELNLSLYALEEALAEFVDYKPRIMKKPRLQPLDIKEEKKVILFDPKDLVI